MAKLDYIGSLLRVGSKMPRVVTRARSRLGADFTINSIRDDALADLP